jgi:hypothetical protein
MAGKVQRFNGHSSKPPVQRYNKPIEQSAILPATALKILAILGAGGVAEEACRATDTVKSNVSYWSNRFVRSKALRLVESQDPQTLGRPIAEQKIGPGLAKYYELTEYGSKLLARGDEVERLNRRPMLLEDRALRFRVLRRESSLVDWGKLGSPRNWRQLGVDVGEVKVELHTGLGSLHLESNVIIHPGQVKGFKAEELLTGAIQIVERTRAVLEKKFGMELSGVGEVVGHPRYHVYTPEARKWFEAAGCIETGDSALDASGTHDKNDALNKIPHNEYKNPEDADIAASLSMGFEGINESVDQAITGTNAPLILRALANDVIKLKAENRALISEVRNLVSTNRSMNEAVGSLVALVRGEGVKGPDGLVVKPILEDYSR